MTSKGVKFSSFALNAVMPRDTPMANYSEPLPAFKKIVYLFLLLKLYQALGNTLVRSNE